MHLPFLTNRSVYHCVIIALLEISCENLGFCELLVILWAAVWNVIIMFYMPWILYCDYYAQHVLFSASGLSNNSNNITFSYQVQYSQNGGKCGVCGDPYQGPIKNQPGPDNLYANGIIVKTYTEGDAFIAKVQVGKGLLVKNSSFWLILHQYVLCLEI